MCWNHRQLSGIRKRLDYAGREHKVSAVNKGGQNLKFHREACEIFLLLLSFPAEGNCYCSYPMKEDLTCTENLCQCPVEMAFNKIQIAQMHGVCTLYFSWQWAWPKIPNLKHYLRVDGHTLKFQGVLLLGLRWAHLSVLLLAPREMMKRKAQHLRPLSGCGSICFSPSSAIPQGKKPAQIQVFNCCSEHPKTHESKISDLYRQHCKKNICFD